MKTFLLMTSPEGHKARELLGTGPSFGSEGFTKNKFSLLCGGSDHPMKLPVYGKHCQHSEVAPCDPN